MIFITGLILFQVKEEVEKKVEEGAAGSEEEIEVEVWLIFDSFELTFINIHVETQPQSMILNIGYAHNFFTCVCKLTNWNRIEIFKKYSII